MSYVITFIVGALVGALVALFAYRNNKAKAEALANKLEDASVKAKAELDSLKK